MTFGDYIMELFKYMGEFFRTMFRSDTYRRP